MSKLSFTSLVEALRFRAEDSSRLAYTFLRDGQSEEESLTYRELDRRACRIAEVIRNSASPGDCVLINHQPGLDYIASFFGCLYAGVVAVPIYPPRFNPRLDRLYAIVKNSGAKVALTSSSIVANIQVLLGELPEMKGLSWIETDRLGEGPGSCVLPDPNGLAFLQYTSGSTSAPKGVMLSHANLMTNVACICDRFEITPESRGVIWLPPYHDMGLIGGLFPTVFAGFPVVLMSPYAFVQRPIRWLQAMSRYRATVSGGPNFAFELCTQRIEDAQIEKIDLSSWRVAFCGAEPIRNEVLRGFAEKFGRSGFKKEAFLPCYGLAEATLIATGSTVAAEPVVKAIDVDKLERQGTVTAAQENHHAPQRVRTVVGCGPVIEGHRLAIVDPERLCPVGEGKVGEVWFSGPSVAQGYWNHPQATQEVFQAKLSDDFSGVRYLRTGDLGFMLGGELFVTGRIKDLLIIRGRNLYPQDIEYSASQSHPSLKTAVAAAFSIQKRDEERLVLLQEADRPVSDEELDGIIDAICAQVLEDHGVKPYAVSIVKRNSLPLTSSGKIQRHLCSKLFLEGQLKERKRYLQPE